MRKFPAIVLSMILLAGCSTKGAQTQSSITAYEGYYKSIEDNERFLDASDYYSISAEMTALSDGTYRYYIFLDDAQIAMYDVVMMAVESDTNYTENSSMMPSIGVFEKSEYSLIPYQSRTEKGYVKGLVISGESAVPEVDLKLLVEWRDKSKENLHREYLAFTLNESGYEKRAGIASKEETDG